MRFGSVCSGIEAASVAWGPLGWKAAWLSEIEPFPCAALAHHYPDVPNLGDMTALPDRIRSGEVEAPDLFCGGTPCQAFSVAGLRQSLDDARGNLSLTFCEIANAIDQRRLHAGLVPAIVFWENVPGVLNTRDNAFGCFLAGLAGEDDALVPAGDKWTNAGVVLGPKRAVAWRVLDAQYFGVAQRRRRVFVVASARTDFDPAAVLLEFDGVRRDTAPRREAREAVAGGVEIGPGGGRFTDLNPTLDTRAKDGPIRNQLAGAVITMAHGQGGAEIGFDRGPTLTCNHEAPIAAYVTHSLRGEGFDASEDGTGRGTPLVPVTAFNINFCDTGGSRPDRRDGGLYVTETEISGALTCAEATTKIIQPVAFHPTQDPISSTDGTTHAMGCGSGGGQASVAVAVALRGREGGATAELGDEVQHCLRASSGGGDKPHVLAAMQVRRLTPVECERLQGFPDDYTLVPNRGKPAADGPRYKALGNSWAVPVVRWIGTRIDAAVNDNTKPAASVAA